MRGFVATRSGTATKTDTPLIETPQSVSVVTTDQVRNQGAVSIGEALRYTAGVSGDVNGGSDTRFGALQIRGFDTTMSGLYVDGLRIPSSNYVHFNGLDPYGAERLEVLKGPSSAMYGGSGTGGILNYVTKLPTAQQFGEFSISGGSFNRYQGQFDMGGPANKEGTVLWRLTGVVRDGGTQVDFTKDNRVFIAPAVTFKPNEDTTITILANYQKGPGRVGPTVPAGLGHGVAEQRPHHSSLVLRGRAGLQRVQHRDRDRRLPAVTQLHRQHHVPADFALLVPAQ